MGKLTILMKFELENLTRFPVLELLLLFLTISSFASPSPGLASSSKLGRELYSLICFSVSHYLMLSIINSYTLTAIAVSSLAALSIAFEAETRQMELLLLQPIKRKDVFLSKILSIQLVVTPIQVMSALLSTATYFHKLATCISPVAILMLLYMSFLSIIFPMSLTLTSFVAIKRSFLSLMISLIILVIPLFIRVEFLPPRVFTNATYLDFMKLFESTIPVLFFSILTLTMDYYLYRRMEL